jgi:DNA repair exonuclease SbcCD ATPase subunit
MTIKRIKITGWRSISCREISLTDGLNVLRGDNEKGKSCVVEALDKALYWDSEARKTEKDNLDYVVPVQDPKAKPTVELDIDFGDCTATLTKVAHPEKAKRSCTLELRLPGQNPQAFEGAEAEAKLRELLGEQESQAVHSSRQGKAHAYLAECLPSSVISAISLSQAGAVVVSKRLEQVRGLVEEERSEKLAKKLKETIGASALAKSDVFRLRQDLDRLNREIEAANGSLQAVEAFRNEIRTLEGEMGPLRQALGPAQANLGSQEKRRRTQDEADRDRQQKEIPLREAQKGLESLEKQLQEIADLRREAEALEGRLSAGQQELDRIDGELEGLEDSRNRLQTEKGEQQGVLEQERRVRSAVETRREVLLQHGKLEQARKEMGEVEALRQEQEDAQKVLEQLGAWPTGKKIGDLRKEHTALAALQRDAQSKLQVQLDLTRPFTVRWKADGQPKGEVDARPGQAASFGAVRSLELFIPDVGAIRVTCGAAELAELLEDIRQKTEKLNAGLKPFGLAASDLPDGFDRLEERRIGGETAERKRDEARRRFQQAVNQRETPSVLRQRVAALEQEVRAAERKLSPLKELVSPDLDADGLAREMDRLKARIAEMEEAQKRLDRQLQAQNGEIQQKSAALAGQRATLSKEKADLSDKKTRIGKLLADGLTDDARRASVGQARINVAGAQQTLQEAKDRLAALGPRITDEELDGLRDGLERQKKNLAGKEIRLAELRTELKNRCSEDPQGTLDRLTGDLEELTAKLRQEERKLEALALLHKVLELQRQQLAKLISRPLNDRIGPWLQQIRGVPTEVAIDDATGKMTEVTTRRVGQSEILPFTELSEGTKEQIAFLVRLTLARVLAEQSKQRPFVVLDDPLTDTSPNRRPEMFRVLSQAAKDMQILFVTCHADSLATLPGQANIIDF